MFLLSININVITILIVQINFYTVQGFPTSPHLSWLPSLNVDTARTACDDLNVILLMINCVHYLAPIREVLSLK
jgi:hypothetical protein